MLRDISDIFTNNTNGQDCMIAVCFKEGFEELGLISNVKVYYYLVSSLEK